VIFSCLDLNAMKTIGQELQRQGMDDVVMIHPNTYNQEFVTDAGDIFEGDYVSVGFVPFEYDTGLESQEKFLEYMEASGAGLSELAMLGWINAHQAYEGLLLAGPDFDRQKLADARNAMTADSAAGLINPIDWTRQHTPPAENDNTNDYANECFSLVKIVDGVFTPVTSDETKPFLCWSTESYDWSEPVETSFE
jgi:ABC-type branched-subunit amino acid transport system substrate-binding protein